MTIDMKNSPVNTGSIVNVEPPKLDRQTVTSANSGNQEIATGNNVSESGLALEKSFENLKDKSDVDFDKVNGIRQQLENGELALDDDALVSALLGSI